MRCTCLTGTEGGIVVHCELPSGPFIRVHILMSQTPKERQEARSALNTVISSSKRTTGVSSTSPPLGRPSPDTHFLSSSNDPRGGWGMASPGSTYREHWWQEDGRLEGSFVACLASPLAGQWLNQGPGVRPSAGAAVGFNPRWAWMCPWEEMLQSTCYLFSEFIVCSLTGPLPTMDQIHHSQMLNTCPESQVVFVNLLDIKHKIRLDFDALHWCTSHSPWTSRTKGTL